MPYFIAGHPGSDLRAMIDLALYLKRHGLKPDKVQDFIPGPMDIATCMYYTGLDPMSGEPVYVPRGARERRLQRALLQYFKPENYADVREALDEAGRLDLIGDGPECLISVASAENRSRNAEEPPATPGARRTGRRLPAAPEDGEAKEVGTREDAETQRSTMSASNDYQLLDFGGGRRLERFGQIMLDRPCPAAEPFERADPDAVDAGRRPLRGTRRRERAMDRVGANCPSDGPSPTARCDSS